MGRQPIHVLQRGRACGLAAALTIAGLAAQAQSPVRTAEPAETAGTADAATQPCRSTPDTPCYLAYTPASPGEGVLHYYASAAPAPDATADAPTGVVIALHGHGRDATKTYAATLAAVRGTNRAALTLVIAPLFQVAAAGTQRRAGGGCSTPGVAEPQAGDLLWTCNSWLAGERAVGGGPSSFAVLDALIVHLRQQWPSLQRATLAGFSAGAQLVQRYVGFAEAQAPHPMPVRYVVADPGTWLYFDPERPGGVVLDAQACTDGAATDRRCVLAWRATDPACPAENRWKYGTEGLPAELGRSAAEARRRYAAADVHYLQGANDTGSGPGTAYSVLDRSCAAQAQGPYRLQRGLAYAEYDRLQLATPHPRRVGIAPGCAHDVACVFPSEAGRAALLGAGLP